MSGIYISGMEMPTRCEDCFCYRHNAEYDYAYCNISSVNVLGHGNARLNNCPLLPVPDHGRLIDADKLRLSHCAECALYPDNCLGKECVWDSIVHIDHAPTIIPGEEGDG